jgi:hypothetical protein
MSHPERNLTHSSTLMWVAKALLYLLSSIYLAAGVGLAAWPSTVAAYFHVGWDASARVLLAYEAFGATLLSAVLCVCAAHLTGPIARSVAYGQLLGIAFFAAVVRADLQASVHWEVYAVVLAVHAMTAISLFITKAPEPHAKQQ